MTDPIMQTADEALAEFAKTIFVLNEVGATGELAALRRLDPQHPNALAFLRLTVTLPAHHLITQMQEKLTQQEIFARLATMARLMANSSGPLRRFGLGAQISAARMTENRLARLLNARGPSLRDIALRLGQQLARHDGSPAYLDLGRLVLFDGWRDDLADEVRLSVARQFVRANRVSPTHEVPTTDHD